jgi:hypothetical protein
MELKAVKNGCDYEIKALHGDTWFSVGKFADCEFGRYVFETDDPEVNDYYNCHFEAADEVSLCDLTSQLRVFRSAYEEIDAETKADMATDRANEAAASRYYEDRGWEDKFIEEAMGR